jgi:F0F1-type ATP synthase assembly protein I
MPVSPKSGRATEDEQIRIGWQMAGLGFEVATMVVGAAGLGWLFDRWRGTAPNGILIASLVGIVVAMTTLVRGTLRLNRRLEAMSATRRTRATDATESPDALDAEPDDWDRRWKDKWGDDDDQS